MAFGNAIRPETDVLSGVQAMATGDWHTCALMMAGGVRCWGLSFFGQLGDGSVADETIPPNRTSPPESDVLSGVQAIAAGGFHTCALMTTGRVRCWGGNLDGQLGDGGATTARAVPPQSDVLSGVQAIAAGFHHTCALTTTGGIRCWGNNEGGQLGDGTETERTSPPDSDVLSGVQAIAAGRRHTCALMTTGGVRCWGGNSWGQLGNGMTRSIEMYCQ